MPTRIGTGFADERGKRQDPDDPCSPVALNQVDPHEPSGAPDCGYDFPYRCDQTYDVGVWWASGAGGQFIVGHPGLDLVLAVKNLPDTFGPRPLWDAVRPALVKLDSTFAGDDEGSCAAYSKNAYAPDLSVETSDIAE